MQVEIFRFAPVFLSLLLSLLSYWLSPVVTCVDCGAPVSEGNLLLLSTMGPGCKRLCSCNGDAIIEVLSRGLAETRYM